jgi:hypothetical protein
MSQDALDLLLSGVKDQGQRKQITTAYYAFANGDPETFAVQFAVLLHAHATSLKLLPARLEKALGWEIHKVIDHVITHQKSVEKMASLIKEEPRKSGGGEGGVDSGKIQRKIEEQLNAHAEVLAKERETIIGAVAANGRLTEKLAADRIVLTLIASYLAGLLTMPVCERLVSLFRPMFH